MLCPTLSVNSPTSGVRTAKQRSPRRSRASATLEMTPMPGHPASSPSRCHTSRSYESPPSDPADVQPKTSKWGYNVFSCSAAAGAISQPSCVRRQPWSLPGTSAPCVPCSGSSAKPGAGRSPSPCWTTGPGPRSATGHRAPAFQHSSLRLLALLHLLFLFHTREGPCLNPLSFTSVVAVSSASCSLQPELPPLHKPRRAGLRPQGNFFTFACSDEEVRRFPGRASADSGSGRSGALSQDREVDSVAERLNHFPNPAPAAPPSMAAGIGDEFVASYPHGQPGFHRFDRQIHGVAHMYPHTAQAFSPAKRSHTPADCLVVDEGTSSCRIPAA